MRPFWAEAIKEIEPKSLEEESQGPLEDVVNLPDGRLEM